MTQIFHIPGKLYLAGEYAVTQAGQAGLVFAIDRFIRIQISQSLTQKQGSFQSAGYQDQPLAWTRKNQQFEFCSPHQKHNLIRHVIRFVESWLVESGHSLQFYDIKIESQLDSPGGKKLGLGSSGAVSVALVKAISQFYGKNLDELSLFKLTSLAHLALGKNGSFGDIAASSFTGFLYYQCFDKQKVIQTYRNKGIQASLDMDWPKLAIQTIKVHPSLKLAVGWTQHMASTDQLVNRAKQQQDKADTLSEAEFLDHSQAVVEQLCPALEAGDFDQIKTLLAANRTLLKHLAASRSIHIETPLLEKLIAIALAFGGASKTSGAGGGDCALALFDHLSLTQEKELKHAWQAAGIVPLNLKIYSKEGDRHDIRTTE